MMFLAFRLATLFGLGAALGQPRTLARLRLSRPTVAAARAGEGAEPGKVELFCAETFLPKMKFSGGVGEEIPEPPRTIAELLHTCEIIFAEYAGEDEWGDPELPGECFDALDPAAAEFLPDGSRAVAGLDAAPAAAAAVARKLEGALAGVWYEAGECSEWTLKGGAPDGRRPGRAIVVTCAEPRAGVPSGEELVEGLGLTGALVMGARLTDESGRVRDDRVPVDPLDFLFGNEAADNYFPEFPDHQMLYTKICHLSEREEHQPDWLLDFKAYQKGEPFKDEGHFRVEPGPFPPGLSLEEFVKLRWGVNLEGHVRVNAIMKAELSDHFAFYFYWEWLDTFPVVWGGRAPDGHVVAVLFTMTWT